MRSVLGFVSTIRRLKRRPSRNLRRPFPPNNLFSKCGRPTVPAFLCVLCELCVKRLGRFSRKARKGRRGRKRKTEDFPTARSGTKSDSWYTRSNYKEIS